MYADIILPVPLNITFTYRIPEQLEHRTVPGARVYVPFGKGRRLTGIVVRTHSVRPDGHTVKDILAVLDDVYLSVLPNQLKLMQWLRE